MNKSELIDRIYEQYNINCSNQLYNKNIESGVKVIINTIIKSLSKGNRIEIRGFGGFNFNHRPARIGRNPKTGEKVSIPEKYVAHFKAGKELRERVNS